MQPVYRTLRWLTVSSLLSPRSPVRVDGRDPNHIRQLREEGFWSDQGYPTPRALYRYFDQFPILAPPATLSPLIGEFHAEKLVIRRAGRVIAKMLPQGRGLAFPELSTIFIGEHGDLGTYLHELGHVLFPGLTEGLSMAIADATRGAYPVQRHTEIGEARCPASGRILRLPPGAYVTINGKHLGLDHSGQDDLSQRDEVWATVFSEFQLGAHLHSEVITRVEAALAHLRVSLF